MASFVWLVLVFFPHPISFSVNKEFGSMWKYCEIRIWHKRWSKCRRSSEEYCTQNQELSKKIINYSLATSHSIRKAIILLFISFFALLLYIIWTFWKPGSSCSKHVEREQVVLMGISWKFSVFLSPQWTHHCRGKYVITLHEQQTGRYILAISLSCQFEKSWKDMKKSPYYVIGYVLTGDFIHFPCTHIQTMLQMLKIKREK